MSMILGRLGTKFSMVLGWMRRWKYLGGLGLLIGITLIAYELIFHLPGTALPIPHRGAHIATDVRFRPQGDLIAAAVDDRCEIWDVATQRHLMTLQPSEGVRSIAWSSDGSLLALTGSGSTINIFNLQGQLQAQLKGPYSEGISDVAWFDEHHVVVSYDELVQVWDVRTKTVQKERHLHRAISAIAVSPHEPVIAVVNQGGYVFLWNWVADELPLRQQSSSYRLLISYRLLEVDFSPDGTKLVLGGDGGMLEVWSTEGEIITSLKPADWVHSIRFHPNRHLVMFETGDVYERGLYNRSIKNPFIYIWDIETGEEVLLVDLKGNWVNALDVSPDGSTVALAYKEGVHLVDISEGKISFDK